MREAAVFATGKEIFMPMSVILNLIVPFVMLLVGTTLKKHPVKDMRSQNGYNTPTSRKSQAHWDYAQEIAPDIYISLGKKLFIAEIILSVVLLILSVSVKHIVTMGTCTGIAVLFYGFYYTDRKIEEKFADK